MGKNAKCLVVYNHDQNSKKEKKREEKKKNPGESHSGK